MNATNEDLPRVPQDDVDVEYQALIAELGLVPERTYRKLKGYTPKTEESLRRRGKCPPFVRLGTEIYYTVEGIKEDVRSRTRKPTGIAGKELL